MADWNKPTLTSLYTDYINESKDRDLDVAKMMDSAVVTVTNPVDDMKRWNSTNRNWEKRASGAWSAMATTYNISIDGAAGAVPFSGITSKPTTLAGYGITDAQPLDSDLTAVAGLSTTGLMVRTGAGTANTRSIAVPTGMSISNADGVAGNPTISLANDLNALESLGSTGIAVRTAADTWAQRTITASTNISVSNGSGAGGNPTISVSPQGSGSGLDADLLDGLNSASTATASTIAARDASGYMWNVYHNQSSSNGENPTISQFMVTNGADGFMRKASVAAVITALGITTPVAASPITNSLGADANLGNAGAFIDGPSVAQGTTGTWFASGQVTVHFATNNSNTIAKLWDGTTLIDSVFFNNANNNDIAVHLSGYIANPAANIKISVKDASVTNTNKLQWNGSGLGKDCTLTAFRIA